MANVLARDSITILHIADIVKVEFFYKLQASTATAPSQPTTYPPSGWRDTEPTYDEGSTDTLYLVECTEYSNGSHEYSSVSVSSSYEAAKVAYNKSVAAMNAVDNMEIGGTNLWIVRDQVSGYVHSNQKSVVAGSAPNWPICSDYIPVTEGESLVIQQWIPNNTATDPPAAYYGFYPEKSMANPVMASRGTFQGASGDTYLSETITVPTGAKYLRISLRSFGNPDSKIKIERGNMPTSWSPAPEDTDSAIAEAQQTASTALQQSVEYIEGTQTAATNKWTGVTTETALYAGKTIAYKLPKAGTSTGASLNLTLAGGGTTGEKEVYLNTTRVTTHFGADSIIQMTYDGEKWRATAIANTNNYDRRLHNNHIKAVTAITAGKLICGTSAGYKVIAANAIFDLSYPILYASAAIKANAQAANAYEVYPSVNLTTTGTIQGAAVNKMAFLKGTLDGNNFIVAGSNFITCTIPTSADGFYYIPLGILANDSTAKCFFTSTNRLFAFVRDQFLPVDVAARNIIASLITSENGKTYFDLDNSKLRTVLYDEDTGLMFSAVEVTGGGVSLKGTEWLTNDTEESEEYNMVSLYRNGLIFEVPIGIFTLDGKTYVRTKTAYVRYINDSDDPSDRYSSRGFYLDCSDPIHIGQDENGNTHGSWVSLSEDAVKVRKDLHAYGQIEIFDPITYDTLDPSTTDNFPHIDFHNGNADPDYLLDFTSRLVCDDRNQLTVEHTDGSKTQFRNGNIELYSATGLIDFHFGISHSGDYSSRIRETSSGVLKSYPSAITSGSDEALKKDILPIDARYLELVDKLEPKEFRFKDSPEYKHLGFIAQDVDDILDEIGIEDKPLVIPPMDEDDYYALDYQQIIPALVAYCQDLRKEINELKSRLGE